MNPLVVTVAAALFAPPQLGFHVEGVGAHVLPYQAARVRITLKNTSKAEAITVYPLELFVAVYSVQGPGDSRPRRVASRVPYAATSQLSFTSTHPTRLHRFAEQHRLVLRPGESETLSFPLDLNRGDPARVLFSLPGEYLLDIRYHGSVTEGHKKTLRVEVDTPCGKEAAVPDWLKENRSVAETLLWPMTVSGSRPDVDPKVLEKFLADHSDSSYADYARFALARIYADGIPHVQTAPDSVKKTVAALLTKIDYRTFPHAPSALVFWHMMAKGDEKNELRRRLDTEFPDAFEWLAEQADLMTSEDWNKLRKEAPVIRGPRNLRSKEGVER